MTGAIGVATDDNFDTEVLKSQVPVLVDFWAPWCQPCLQLMPTIEEIAKEYENKVKFLKVNVEENSAVQQMLNVRGIPALILFIDGEPVVNKVGGDLSRSQLSTLLDSNL